MQVILKIRKSEKKSEKIRKNEESEPGETNTHSTCWKQDKQGETTSNLFNMTMNEWQEQGQK